VGKSTEQTFLFFHQRNGRKRGANAFLLFYFSFKKKNKEIKKKVLTK